MKPLSSRGGKVLEYAKDDCKDGRTSLVTIPKRALRRSLSRYSHPCRFCARMVLANSFSDSVTSYYDSGVQLVEGSPWLSQTERNQQRQSTTSWRLLRPVSRTLSTELTLSRALTHEGRGRHAFRSPHCVDELHSERELLSDGRLGGDHSPEGGNVLHWAACLKIFERLFGADS